jgi:hypothetical protein
VLASSTTLTTSEWRVIPVVYSVRLPAGRLSDSDMLQHDERTPWPARGMTEVAVTEHWPSRLACAVTVAVFICSMIPDSAPHCGPIGRRCHWQAEPNTGPVSSSHSATGASASAPPQAPTCCAEAHRQRPGPQCPVCDGPALSRAHQHLDSAVCRLALQASPPPSLPAPHSA